MQSRLLLAGLVAVALTASPILSANAGNRVGTVTTIDDASKTFSCHWKTSDSTYTTTDQTVFRMARKPARFSDLKVGETVQIEYHVVNKDWVADRVVINTK